MILGILFVIGTWNLVIPIKVQAVTSKPALTQNDFKYIGAFAIPNDWGAGLTHRYVGGQLRMITFGVYGNSIFETNVPTPSLTAPFPRATVVKDWGTQIGADKQYLDNYGAPSGFKFGLHWDSVDQRLYWNYQDIYNTCCPNQPSIGYSTLNDATGVATNFGPWRFPGYSKMSNTCTMTIPQWFVDAYVPGKRLGAGCGGYQSILAVGPISFGPSLVAFSPQDMNTVAEQGNLPYKALIGYPYPGPRAQRNTDYYSLYGGDINPTDGIGYQTWGGQFQNVWIDLPNKSGLVSFATLAKGREWYQNSTGHVQRSTHEWYIYDTTDLAAVAQGTKQPWEIQQSSRFNVEYQSPGITYPMPQLLSNLVDGVTFDSTTNKLYVSVQWGESGFVAGSWHVVFVYQVGDNIGWVNPPAHVGVPQIVFDISPTTLPEEAANGDISTDTVYLTWDARGATSATLSGFGSVAIKDTKRITPVVTTTTYTLTATNASGTSSQQVTVNVPAGGPIVGDINLDHIVNSIDYSILNSDWFSSNARSDLNSDGLVNAIDYSILNANWFRTW